MEMMFGVNKSPATMMKLRNRKRNDDVLKKKNRKNQKEKDIKVTYISSPMKVKTSASNFRALVQELTGKYSNVAEKFIQQESASDDDDDYENEAAMAGALSNVVNSNEQHEVKEEDFCYVPMCEEGSSSTWLDLLTEDNCGGSFQNYSRSLLEPFNQQHYMKFDLVEI